MSRLSDIPDIDRLLKFLRIDRNRIEIDKLAVHSNSTTKDIIVDITYIDKRTQQLKRSSIPIPCDTKIDEYPITTK